MPASWASSVASESWATEVSGASVHALRDFLAQRLGEQGLPQLRKALPPEVAMQYLDTPLSYMQHIPEEGMRRVLNQAAIQTGTNIMSMIFEMGQHTLPFIVKHAGYEQCIRRVAPDLVGFARCLTQLLAQMYLALTGRSPPMPEAQITDVGADSFTLGVFVPEVGGVVRSTASLAIFKGMLQWAAEELFAIQLQFTDRGVTTLSTGLQTQSFRAWAPPPVPANFTLCTSPSNSKKSATKKNVMGLDPDTFAKLFPWHFSVDLNFRVLQAGEALENLFPQLSRPGTHIGEVLQIRVPEVPWSMDCLQGVLESDMTTRVVLTGKCGLGLELRGGLHRVWQMQGVECGWLAAGQEAVMFLGAPCISSVGDMERLGLYLSDFPPHDMAPEQVLVAASKQAQAAEALHEVAQDNNALKETLAETLASQQHEAGRANLSFQCAGHMMLSLLDALVLGDEVTAQQVLSARAALLRSGDSVWKPIDFGSKSLVEDKEVNASLAKMLGTPAGAWRTDEEPAHAEQELGMSPTSSTFTSARASHMQGVAAFVPRRGSALSFTSPAGSARRGLRRNLSQADLASVLTAVHQQGMTQGFDPKLAQLADSLSSGGKPAVLPEQEVAGTIGSDDDDHVNQDDVTAPSMKRWLKESMCKVLKPFRSQPGKDKPDSASSTPPRCISPTRDAIHPPDIHSPEKPARKGMDLADMLSDSWAKQPLPGHGVAPKLHGYTLQPPCIPSQTLGGLAQEAGVCKPVGERYRRASTVAIVQHVSEPESRSQLSSGKLPLPTRQMDAAASLRLLQQPEEEVLEALRGYEEWQFDSLALDRATQGRPLSFLAFHLMQRMGVAKRLHLDERKLSRFLMRIEDGYGSNPYHNRIHAADVLRSFHVILTRGGVLETMAKNAAETASPDLGSGQALVVMGHDQPDAESLQLLSCYLAAIVHDYEHKGVNNDFLIRSCDSLALLYNDMSPMENHHLAASFTLMQDNQYAFLPVWSKQARAQIRKSVVELVLATDMKQHFALTASFAHKVATAQPRREGQATGDMALRLQGLPRMSFAHSRPLTTVQLPNGDQSGEKVFTWDHETEVLVLKMALKAADLGHLTSSIDVHKQWVARLEDELFLQGDRERALGQPISPLMDRTKAGIQRSQTGFFKVVALPMYQGFAQAFPKCSALLTSLEHNAEYWRCVEAESAAPGGAK